MSIVVIDTFQMADVAHQLFACGVMPRSLLGSRSAILDRCCNPIVAAAYFLLDSQAEIDEALRQYAACRANYR